MLYKISRTVKSKHIGTFHYDIINAKYAKQKAGSGYHIYGREPIGISGKTKWVLIMR